MLHSSKILVTEDGDAFFPARLHYIGSPSIAERVNLALATQPEYCKKTIQGGAGHDFEQKLWSGPQPGYAATMSSPIARRHFGLRALSEFSYPHGHAISFKKTTRGKIITDRSDLGVCFSLSKPYCLFALADTNHIGIDIERNREIPKSSHIILSASAAGERHLVNKFQAIFEETVSQSFLRYFTLKESYIKALGAGISCFNDFELTMENGVLTVAHPLGVDNHRYWNFLSGSFNDDLMVAVALPDL